MLIKYKIATSLLNYKESRPKFQLLSVRINTCWGSTVCNMSMSVYARDSWNLPHSNSLLWWFSQIYSVAMYFYGTQGDSGVIVEFHILIMYNFGTISLNYKEIMPKFQLPSIMINTYWGSAVCDMSITVYARDSWNSPHSSSHLWWFCQIYSVAMYFYGTQCDSGVIVEFQILIKYNFGTISLNYKEIMPKFQLAS